MTTTPSRISRESGSPEQETLDPRLRGDFAFETSRIAVHSLTLTAFRNYEQLTLVPDGQSVVLTGPNGAGKTNILEAVSLLAPGRGLRGAKLEQLRNQAFGGTGWGVAMEVDTGQGTVHFGTGQQPGREDKRVLRLEGEPLKNQAELARHFAVLWQTPQMDTLFTEGMSERRRFFDRLVCSFDPEHAGQMAKYDYLMRERNRLLAQPRWEETWLASLEHKMAEVSLAKAAARIETMQALQQAVETLHPDFPKAEIVLKGRAEAALLAGDQSALEIEEKLAVALVQSREEDAHSGRSSHGAHRMEFYVTHRDKQTEAAYCSTGEQKALLLSLLLAQAQAMKEKQGRLPILLLDEVVAHLDATRRTALFAVLEELAVQAWLTGTDRVLFAGFDGLAPRLEADGGKITKIAV